MEILLLQIGFLCKKKRKEKNADFTLTETYLWQVDCMFLPADTLEILSSSRTDGLMCRERRWKSFFSLWLNYRPMNGGGSGIAWCKCNAALSLHTLVHKQNKEVIWDITGKKTDGKKKCSIFAHRKWLCPSEMRQRTMMMNINLRNEWNCRKFLSFASLKLLFPFHFFFPPVHFTFDFHSRSNVFPLVCVWCVCTGGRWAAASQQIK